MNTCTMYCLLISAKVLFRLWSCHECHIHSGTEDGNLLPRFLGMACASAKQSKIVISSFFCREIWRRKLLCSVCLAQRQSVRSVKVFLVIKFRKGYESLYLYWVTLRREITNVWFFSSMDFEINAYFCSSLALGIFEMQL